MENASKEDGGGGEVWRGTTRGASQILAVHLGLRVASLAAFQFAGLIKVHLHEHLLLPGYVKDVAAASIRSGAARGSTLRRITLGISAVTQPSVHFLFLLSSFNNPLLVLLVQYIVLCYLQDIVADRSLLAVIKPLQSFWQIHIQGHRKHLFNTLEVCCLSSNDYCTVPWNGFSLQHRL